MYDLKDIFSNNLCRRCTGRIFAEIGSGLTNDQRGDMLIFSYKCTEGVDRVELPDEENCRLCSGIFKRFDGYFSIIDDKLKGYQYETFLIGSIFAENVIKEEEGIQEKFGSRGESIKKEFNREFGKFFSIKSGKNYSKKDPDIMITVNTEYDYVNVLIKSLYIYGKYRKLRRDMPQTRWIKKPSGDSVESVIGDALNSLAGGSNYHLHGAGREDVDVRMLGNGREFVIESENPKIRDISLIDLENTVNGAGKGVYIFDLKFVDRETVKKIKQERYDKVYRAIIVSKENIDASRMKAAVESLNGKNIYQRTPLRVAKTRSDMVRTRLVKSMEIASIEANKVEIIIKAEAGTYIKELVNGDEGRTNPSLSAIYGGDLEIKELDVINICRGDE